MQLKQHMLRHGHMKALRFLELQGLNEIVNSSGKSWKLKSQRLVRLQTTLGDL